MGLEGKTVIVTGGGQGLGRAIALCFGGLGANVVINGRTESTLNSVLEELRGQGVRAEAVIADVRRRSDARATVDTAVASFGGVDILINNAQVAQRFTRVEDIDDASLDEAFSGFKGTLNFMQACLPSMRERGGGVIVNMGSPMGISGDRMVGAYAANKEAIRGLTRTAAREWGRHNIRVNVVCPAALTTAAAEFRDTHPEAFNRMLESVPLGRIGDEMDDIAQAVAALAGDGMQYLTGSTLMLDGGRLMLT